MEANKIYSVIKRMAALEDLHILAVLDNKPPVGADLDRHLQGVVNIWCELWGVAPLYLTETGEPIKSQLPHMNAYCYVQTDDEPAETTPIALTKTPLTTAFTPPTASFTETPSSTAALNETPSSTAYQTGGKKKKKKGKKTTWKSLDDFERRASEPQPKAQPEAQTEAQPEAQPKAWAQLSSPPPSEDIVWPEEALRRDEELKEQERIRQEEEEAARGEEAALQQQIKEEEARLEAESKNDDDDDFFNRKHCQRCWYDYIMRGMWDLDDYYRRLVKLFKMEPCGHYICADCKNENKDKKDVCLKCQDEVSHWTLANPNLYWKEKREEDEQYEMRVVRLKSSSYRERQYRKKKEEERRNMKDEEEEKRLRREAEEECIVEEVD